MKKLQALKHKQSTQPVEQEDFQVDIGTDPNAIRQAQKEHEEQQSTEELYDKIKKDLDRNKQPNEKVIADYINSCGNYYRNYDTNKRYVKIGDELQEINEDTISIHLNNIFGKNKLSSYISKKVLSFITDPIEQNFNIIEFSNGLLNTATMEFKEGQKCENILPKLKTQLIYTPDAEEAFKSTKLYNMIEDILYYEPWEWNSKMFYKCVGAAGQAKLTEDKLCAIVGAPSTRKSTLLNVLKRIFNYSQISLQTIAARSRFQLIPIIGKDINIDDDCTNFMIKDVGFLNTFISGNGGQIEKKMSNEWVELTSEITPFIFCAGNKLPSVLSDDGFSRRTIVIKAENVIEGNNANNTRQEILEGLFDEEIGKLFSYCLQLFYKEKQESKPLVTDDKVELMHAEWKWRSYPQLEAAKILFKTSDEILDELEEDPTVEDIVITRWSINYTVNNDGVLIPKIINTYTTVKETNSLFRRFLIKAYSLGKISKKDSQNNTKTVKKTMEGSGYEQINKSIVDESGSRTTEKVYDDCVINENWKEDLEGIV